MRWRRLGETLHLTALGVWLGAIIFGAAIAATIFPTMHDLDPTLGAYGAYEGEHWRLAAGIVAARTFAILDIVQFVCAFIAFGTLGAGLLLWVPRSISAAVRIIAMGLAMALVSFWLFIMGPMMEHHLTTYWAAAAAGDNALAAKASAAFSAFHPGARAVLSGQAVLVLIALVSGCWSAMGRRSVRGEADGEA